MQLIPPPVRVLDDDTFATATATDPPSAESTKAYVDAFGAGATLVRKTADESVTSSAVLQNDNHLLFAIAASDVWIGRFVLKVTGSTAGDISFDVTVPAGAGGWYSVIGPSRSNTTLEGDALIQARDFGSGAGSAGLIGGSSPTLVVVQFYVANGATPGNVQLQWCQRVSDATATTVLTGSHLIAHEVPS